MQRQEQILRPLFTLLFLFFLLTLTEIGRAQTTAQLLSEGDRWLSSQKYGKALACYHDVLILENNHATATDKIREVEEKLSDTQLQKALFEENVTQGAERLNAGNFQEALLAYKAASYLRPSSSYPKNKIKEITRKYPDPVVEKGYNNAIGEGDNAFASGNYSKAEKAYAQALRIKPLESYPTTRLEKAKEMITQSEIVEEKYSKLIEKADELKKTGKEKEALTYYQQASEMIPSKRYPREQLAILKEKMEKAAALQADFEKIITEGDNLYMAQKYEAAKKKYREAQKVKPSDSYPKNMISRIEEALQKRQSQQAAFDKLIQEGDAQKASGNRETAMAKYREALTLLPQEPYPAEQIKALETLMAKEKATEEAFNEAIAKADNHLENDELKKALSAYTEALALKPDAPYALEQQEKINNLLRTQQAEKEAQYNAQLKKAEQSLTKKDYAAALTAFTQASEIFPEEAYPKTQITEITHLIQQTEKTETQYLTTIAKADKLFKEKAYSEAEQAYQEAMQLKPDETYPQQQLEEAKRLLTTIQEVETQYENAIREGDQRYASSNLDEALIAYRKAGKLKPQEAYPKTQIAKIETLREELAQKSTAYNRKIKTADRHFENKEYEKAREAYQEAKALKPEETYPNEQLTLIANALSQLKEQEAHFNKALSTAEAHFEATRYEEALTAYKEAASIMPDNALIKGKIEETEQQINQMATKRSRYESLLRAGEKAFAEKEYLRAREKYQKAAELFPAEEQPQTRLSEIQKQMEQLEKEYRLAYDKAIETADNFFQKGQYKSALEHYREAKNLLSSASYPDEKIKETEAIIREQETTLLAEYRKFISKADSEFRQKRYANALKAYEQANKLGTEEAYPQQRINEINELIAQQIAVDIEVQRRVFHEKEGVTLTFKPLHYSQKKNNYILLTARNSGEETPKIFLSFGKGNQKNGGVVLHEIESQEPQQYVIPLENMERWYREENNWIKLFVSSGSVEVISVQISNVGNL